MARWYGKLYSNSGWMHRLTTLIGAFVDARISAQNGSAPAGDVVRTAGVLEFTIRPEGTSKSNC